MITIIRHRCGKVESTGLLAPQQLKQIVVAKRITAAFQMDFMNFSIIAYFSNFSQDQTEFLRWYDPKILQPGLSGAFYPNYSCLEQFER